MTQIPVIMTFNEDKRAYRKQITHHHTPAGSRALQAERELSQPRTPQPNVKAPTLSPEQRERAHADLQASMAAMEKAKKAHEERMRAEAEKPAEVRAAEMRRETQVLQEAGFYDLDADPLAAAAQGVRDGQSKAVMPQQGKPTTQTPDEIRTTLEAVRGRLEQRKGASR